MGVELEELVVAMAAVVMVMVVLVVWVVLVVLVGATAERCGAGHRLQPLPRGRVGQQCEPLVAQALATAKGDGTVGAVATGGGATVAWCGGGGECV